MPYPTAFFHVSVGFSQAVEEIHGSDRRHPWRAFSAADQIGRGRRRSEKCQSATGSLGRWQEGQLLLNGARSISR
ncbi:MAG: hypothetical protein P8N11_00235 [Gammaproteobacteria bacterium]|nr:hypothetical protein [Gammaproteobacteria bacterium]